MTSIRNKEYAEAVLEQWNQYRRSTGKWYKLIPLIDGRIERVIARLDRKGLHCLAVASHNMARHRIHSRPQVTSLNLVVERDGTIEATIAPASAADVELFCKCWPDQRALLCRTN